MRNLRGALAVSALILSSCSSSASTPSANSTATTTRAETPGPAASSNGGVDYSGLICDAIKEVQTEAAPNTPGGGYLAALTLKLLNILPEDGDGEAIDDAEIEATCPADYEAILKLAEIRSIKNL